MTALWPGSAIHAQAIFKNPRFEDFEYTYLEEGKHFAWMGNGLTFAQSEGGKTTTYLDTVDIPPPIVEGINLWDPLDPYEQIAISDVNLSQSEPSLLDEKLAKNISSMPT